MSTREEMLGRIRKALARTGDSQPGASLVTLPELGPVMPPIPPGELISRFESEFNQVGGRTYRVGTIAELDKTLRTILVRPKSQSESDPSGVGVVLSRNPLLSRLGLLEALSSFASPVRVWPQSRAQGEDSAPRDASGTNYPEQGERQAFKEQCFGALAGITGVDFVLAESGSLVLSSTTEGSQLVSLAPPIHVALYRQEQVFESLEEVLATTSPLSTASGNGRSVVFVTGTSRTADIEQIMIRGVHGPREVHAILVEESCLA